MTTVPETTAGPRRPFLLNLAAVMCIVTGILYVTLGIAELTIGVEILREGVREMDVQALWGVCVVAGLVTMLASYGLYTLRRGALWTAIGAQAVLVLCAIWGIVSDERLSVMAALGIVAALGLGLLLSRDVRDHLRP